MGFKEADQRVAERRQVARGAAGDEVAILYHGLVHPDAAGIFQVVFNAERAGNAFTHEDFGRDGDPAAMADEGDQLALQMEFAREAEDIGIAA